MTVSPFYTIHQYREDMFKVVAFKRVSDPDHCYIPKEERQHYDNKLDNNISRARSMVLQYALCNPWEYFFTGTLDKSKFDRFNLDTFAGRLMQFIRDKRKSYGVKFDVLLVPERHRDGAWHIHGLIHGLPEQALCRFSAPAPQKLIDGGFFDWPDYRNKFGFCSLAPIRDPIATAYYITKYISKDLAGRSNELGKHLYFHSRPLKKAEVASRVYYPNRQLDGYCTQEFDFCKTGMVNDAPWYFPLVWDGVEYDLQDLCPVPMSDPLADFDPQTVEPPREVWEQTRLWV